MIRPFLYNLIHENWDFVLGHALKNFHVPGFNSLLLMQAPELTVRLYLIRPGECPALADINDNQLLIHNHRFSFESMTLCGRVQNRRFQEVVLPADSYDRYEYFSALEEKHRLDFQERVYLQGAEVEEIEEGTSYSMLSWELHRIALPQDQFTAILFMEHTRQEIPALLYSQVPLTPENDPCALPELYQHFEEAELQALVQEFFKHLPPLIINEAMAQF
jgi:hypothetical protein